MISGSAVRALPVFEYQLQCDGAIVMVGAQPVGGGDGFRQRIGAAEEHGVQCLSAAKQVLLGGGAAKQAQFQMAFADDFEMVMEARLGKALVSYGVGSVMAFFSVNKGQTDLSTGVLLYFAGAAGWQQWIASNRMPGCRAGSAA